MALIIRPFNFESEPPTMQKLQNCAEKLGGLLLQVESDYGGVTNFEFDFLRGKVSARRCREVVVLRSNTGEAPVLVELLSQTLEDLGGKRRSSGVEVELQFPLTEEFVISKTDEFRKLVRKSAGRLWLTVFGLLVLGLATISLIAWVAWFSLFRG